MKGMSMLTIRQLYSTSIVSGIAVIMACLLPVPGLAGSAQSRDEVSVRPSVRAEAASTALVDCGLGGKGAREFTVKRSNGETRVMELCGVGDGSGASGTAQALSDALDAQGAGGFEFPFDARFKLMTLQLARARAEVEASMAADAKARQRAAIDRAIEALERAKPRG
jgi:hypothetical protein